MVLQCLLKHEYVPSSCCVTDPKMGNWPYMRNSRLDQYIGKRKWKSTFFFLQWYIKDYSVLGVDFKRGEGTSTEDGFTNLFRYELQVIWYKLSLSAAYQWFCSWSKRCWIWSIRHCLESGWRESCESFSSGCGQAKAWSGEFIIINVVGKKMLHLRCVLS